MVIFTGLFSGKEYNIGTKSDSLANIRADFIPFLSFNSSDNNLFTYFVWPIFELQPIAKIFVSG